MKPDRIKATWHVLRRIKNSRSDDAKVPFNLYEFGADSSSPSSDLQYEALLSLRASNVIDFHEEQSAAFIEPDLQYTQYELLLNDKVGLNRLYTEYEQLIQELAKQTLIVVVFDGNSARINGLPFPLRGKNKRLFSLLYKRANQWATQVEVLKAARYEGAYSSKSANMDFNTYIGNLRKTLRLTPLHIVVNDKHVMLKCEVES